MVVGDAWKSMLDYFEKLVKPDSSAHLRDIEPLVGIFLRNAQPIESPVFQSCMESLHSDSEAFRRGGYLLQLLCYYGPHSEDWSGLLMHQKTGWLIIMSDIVDKSDPLIPFYPNDARVTPADDMVYRWHLSCGVLYDRIKKLTNPPYVC